MDKKQMPISELPFNFDGLEPQYGQIKHAELICPGVYFIMTKFNTDRAAFRGRIPCGNRGLARHLPRSTELHHPASDHSKDVPMRV